MQTMSLRTFMQEFPISVECATSTPPVIGLPRLAANGGAEAQERQILKHLRRLQSAAFDNPVDVRPVRADRVENTLLGVGQEHWLCRSRTRRGALRERGGGTLRCGIK